LADSERERWDGWLGPTQWMPVIGILSVAVIALAVMLILNLGGDDAGNGGTSAGRPPAHEHADLALVINGEKFDFSDEQFLSDLGGEELNPNVHIHAPRTNVVHTHTALTTWDEFFRSVGFRLTDPSFPGVDAPRTCLEMPGDEKLCSDATNSWKFVVNGVPVDGVANVYIGNLDRVLISYGPETVEQVIAQQWSMVTDEACIPSELCKARIDPNEPPEPCSGKDQCTR